MQPAESRPIEPMPIIPIGDSSRPLAAAPPSQQPNTGTRALQGHRKPRLRRRRIVSSATSIDVAARRRSRLRWVGAALGLGFIAARFLKRAA